MQWYLAKIQTCTFAIINNFEIWQVSIACLSDTVWSRNLKLFLYINTYRNSIQTKFHVPRSHSFREKCDDNLKLASHISPILSDRGTWNFFLYIKPYGYSMQTKFHVVRSHSFREKCDDNLKLASHFSPILCDQGTWNFVCILTHMELYANQISCTSVTQFSRKMQCYLNSDDNLKLASHFSPILCDRGTWNFFCTLNHMDTFCKQNFMYFGCTLFEKNAMITCKNSKLHNYPNKQLWNFTS